MIDDYLDAIRSLIFKDGIPLDMMYVDRHIQQLPIDQRNDLLTILNHFPELLFLRDAEGRTLLHIACEFNDYNLLADLENRFSSNDAVLQDMIFATDSLGRNLFHYAALTDGERIIKLLHSWHLDINAQTKDDFRETPLHIAVRHEHGKTAKALLELGALSNILNAKQKTSCGIASDEIKKIIADYSQYNIEAKLQLENAKFLRTDNFSIDHNPNKTIQIFSNQELHVGERLSAKFHISVRPDHVERATYLLAPSLQRTFDRWKVLLTIYKNARLCNCAQITLYLVGINQESRVTQEELIKHLTTISELLEKNKIAITEIPRSDIPTIFPGISMRAALDTQKNYLSSQFIGKNSNPVNLRWKFEKIASPPSFEVFHHFQQFSYHKSPKHFLVAIRYTLEAILNQYTRLGFYDTAKISELFSTWINPKAIKSEHLYPEHQNQANLTIMLSKTVILRNYFYNQEKTNDSLYLLTNYNFISYHAEEDDLGLVCEFFSFVRHFKNDSKLSKSKPSSFCSYLAGLEPRFLKAGFSLFEDKQAVSPNQSMPRLQTIFKPKLK